MARLVTVQSIVNRAREHADMRDTGFFTDAEILNFVNDAYTELYDLLVTSFQNYFVERQNITLVGGQTTYDFPDEVYKIIGVDLLASGSVGSGTWTTLQPFNENERNSILGVSADIPAGQVVRLIYAPAPAVLTLADSVDGVAGWDALLVCDVAIAMLDAEESDTDRLERRRQRIYTRVVGASQNRDISIPGRVTDIYETNLLNVQDTLRYRFYGDTIEFISVIWTGVPT